MERDFRLTESRSSAAKGRRRWAYGPALCLLGPLLAFMLAFYVAPFGNMVVESFRSWHGDGPHTQLTTKQYAKTLDGGRNTRVLLRTFRISLITTIATFAVSFPMALVVLRVGPTVRAAALLLLFGSLASSLIVRNYGWLVVLADNGAFNAALLAVGIIDRPLRLTFSEGATIVALVHYCMPFMILPVYGSLLRLPRTYTDASASLGATSWNTLRKIVVPLSIPGIFGGTMLTFAISMSAFVTPLMLGSPATAMISQVAAEQLQVQLNFPLGSAIIVVLTVTTFVIVIAYGLAVRRMMRVHV